MDWKILTSSLVTVSLFTDTKEGKNAVLVKLFSFPPKRKKKQ
jgi:hypothetical protein